jgi:hypothetical protein
MKKSLILLFIIVVLTGCSPTLNEVDLTEELLTIEPSSTLPTLTTDVGSNPAGNLSPALGVGTHAVCRDHRE